MVSGGLENNVEWEVKAIVTSPAYCAIVTSLFDFNAANKEREAAKSVWDTAVATQKDRTRAQDAFTMLESFAQGVKRDAENIDPKDAAQKDATDRTRAQDAASAFTVLESFARDVKRDAENIDPKNVKQQRLGQEHAEDNEDGERRWKP
ncbi:hypothetical protein BC938DRAFT_483936 [Jimgerdemannia flammicorona]|uniref:Uncharacterized protein n=1 Tax=Jimgerdemannia flammicorona TaxID=994334 RepID=A0A433QAT5_9FUNG|nr:hypothetical protein BC938DRAFT_483936 [Jimgerdemannia flammicorona]